MLGLDGPSPPARGSRRTARPIGAAARLSEPRFTRSRARRAPFPARIHDRKTDDGAASGWMQRLRERVCAHAGGSVLLGRPRRRSRNTAIRTAPRRPRATPRPTASRSGDAPAGPGARTSLASRAPVLAKSSSRTSPWLPARARSPRPRRCGAWLLRVGMGPPPQRPPSSEGNQCPGPAAAPRRRGGKLFPRESIRLRKEASSTRPAARRPVERALPVARPVQPVLDAAIGGLRGGSPRSARTCLVRVKTRSALTTRRGLVQR